MILPNNMDGVPYVTQEPVPNGGEYVYEFVPGPPGSRWYHSHVGEQLFHGLFGMIVIDDAPTSLRISTSRWFFTIFQKP